MRHDRRGQSGSRRVLGGLCVLVLWASACTSEARSASPPTDDTPRGGTLRIALLPDGSLEDSAFLDPQRPYDMFFRFETELLRCCLVRTLLSHAGLSTEEGGTVLRPDLAADLPEGLTGRPHLDVPAQGGAPLRAAARGCRDRHEPDLKVVPVLDDLNLRVVPVARPHREDVTDDQLVGDVGEPVQSGKVLRPRGLELDG